MSEPHVFDLQHWDNLLDRILLDSKQIRAQITHYSLCFLPFIHEVVEWKTAFPMFVDAFYAYILVNERVPAQDEFYEHYLRFNADFFRNNSFDDKMEKGLKARIYRAYPSLVRDLYFGKYLSEEWIDASVLYHPRLDVEEGIDMMIVYRHVYFAIHLFTDTIRANRGRDRKQSRHKLFENVCYLQLPVRFNGSVQCGEFFLYGAEEMKLLQQCIGCVLHEACQGRRYLRH